jgi:hypothetical protein
MMEAMGEEKFFFCEVDIAPLDEQFQPMVKNYPLFPESIEIKSEWLSPDQKKRWKLNSGSDYEPVTILTTTFFEKKGYVTSYNYLKLALEAGYQITRFIKICEFDSNFVMADYVKKIYGDKRQGSIIKNELTKKIAADPTNADLKAQLAAVECLISSAKLKANGLFGATITNVLKHSETEMIPVENTRLLKKGSVPSFQDPLQG